jgi:hypothetical protein
LLATLAFLTIYAVFAVSSAQAANFAFNASFSNGSIGTCCSELYR